MLFSHAQGRCELLERYLKLTITKVGPCIGHDLFKGANIFLGGSLVRYPIRVANATGLRRWSSCHFVDVRDAMSRRGGETMNDAQPALDKEVMGGRFLAAVLNPTSICASDF